MAIVPKEQVYIPLNLAKEKLAKVGEIHTHHDDGGSNPRLRNLHLEFTFGLFLRRSSRICTP